MAKTRRLSSSEVDIIIYSTVSTDVDINLRRVVPFGLRVKVREAMRVVSNSNVHHGWRYTGYTDQFFESQACELVETLI